MSILVRKIRVAGSQLVDASDSEFDSQSLILGSSVSCDVQLFGRDTEARHLRLDVVGSGAKFECLSNAFVAFQNEDKRSGLLAIGDEIQLGSSRLKLIEAPPGFQLALEIQVDADLEQSSRVRHAAELRAATPPLRAISYGLIALIAVIGLALPLYAYWQEDNSQANGDLVWTTGPQLLAHQSPAIGDDCGVCHTEAFTPVQDETCLACHSEIRGHRPGHAALGFDDSTCIACHREHSEPEAIVISGSDLCVNCHKQDIQSELPVLAGSHGATIKAASAFTKLDHPPFALSALRLGDDDHWQLERAAPGEEIQEMSNLKFPHDLHLDDDKVSFDDGRILSCDGCHDLQSDGEHFAPITMERQCAACHTLGLDVRYPGRRVPHAPPNQVREYLEQYHTTQYARQRDKLVERPAGAPPRAEEPVIAPECLSDAGIVRCGLELADREMDRLFEKSGCVECHSVQRAGADGSWEVLPVQLTEDWYPQAGFNHTPHLQLGAADAEASCLTCHEAQSSSHSEDVLMPGQENCLDCHATDHESGVPLMCQDCHSMHRESLPPMQAGTLERAFWRELTRKLGVPQ